MSHHYIVCERKQDKFNTDIEYIEKLKKNNKMQMKP